jgi:hypothetical protein
LFQSGLLIGTLSTDNIGTQTVVASGSINFSGEFNGTIEQNNFTYISGRPNVLVGGRIMIGSLDITNAYFERFFR